MKTQMHSKAIAIAAVVMLGLATTSGAALARIGSLWVAGSTAGRMWATRFQLRRRSSIPPVDTLCRRRPRHRSRRQVLDQYSTNRRVP